MDEHSPLYLLPSLHFLATHSQGQFTHVPIRAILAIESMEVGSMTWMPT